jgi:2-dehydro-3-deoxy-D-arabinonate dehydratase
MEENFLDLGIGDSIELIYLIQASGLTEEAFLNYEYDLKRLPRHKIHDSENGFPDGVRLLKPVVPPEVWACGVTYLRSRAARETETKVQGIYERVYDAKRPEVFFKSTASRCADPFQPVYIRGDSAWCVPEPELAVVVGSEGRILGFTIGNDMTARDIEGENPLYLPQAKIYDHCCSIGPALVTSASIGDSGNLAIRMSILRDEVTVFQGQSTTSLMKRTIAELLQFLFRDNPVPTGSICFTGTGIVPPNDFALKDNDLIEITIDGIGTLKNPVRQLQHTRH